MTGSSTAFFPRGRCIGANGCPSLLSSAAFGSFSLNACNAPHRRNPPALLSSSSSASTAMAGAVACITCLSPHGCPFFRVTGPSTLMSPCRWNSSLCTLRISNIISWFSILTPVAFTHHPALLVDADAVHPFHVNAGAQNRVPCVTSSSAACLSRPSLSKVRTCPVSGAFIVHVYQVSITAHSFPSIFEGNGTTCLCFVSSTFLATTAFTPVCNVFWSSAVHPLRMVYWSASHRSRTSSSDHFICNPLYSRTSYSLPSNPVIFPATYPFFPLCRTVPPISSSPRAASLSFGVWGVCAFRCSSPAHTILSCTPSFSTAHSSSFSSSCFIILLSISGRITVLSF